MSEPLQPGEKYELDCRVVDSVTTIINEGIKILDVVCEYDPCPPDVQRRIDELKNSRAKVLFHIGEPQPDRPTALRPTKETMAVLRETLRLLGWTP